MSRFQEKLCVIICDGSFEHTLAQAICENLNEKSMKSRSVLISGILPPGNFGFLTPATFHNRHV